MVRAVDHAKNVVLMGQLFVDMGYTYAVTVSENLLKN